MQRKLPKWLIGLFFIFTSLALLEGGARALYQPKHQGLHDSHFEHDSEKVYRWKASHAGIFGEQPFQTNEQNRIGNVYGQKSDKKRISWLGDSVSSGFRVPYESTVVPQLEQLLEAEILNFSVPGYSTFQHYFDLQRSLGHCPDLVLIQFQANDLVEPFHYLKRLGGVGIDYHQVPDSSGAHIYLRSRSRFYAFIANLFLKSESATFGKAEAKSILERSQSYNAQQTLEHPEHPNSQRAWAEFDHALASIGAVCRLQKIQCVFLLSPSSFQHFSPSPLLNEGIALLKKKIENETLTWIDPWPAFSKAMLQKQKRAEKDPVKLWAHFFLDDAHPNASGHQFYAQYLSSELRAILEKIDPRKCGS